MQFQWNRKTGKKVNDGWRVITIAHLVKKGTNMSTYEKAWRIMLGMPASKFSSGGFLSVTYSGQMV
jgi:hypothetical protein